MFIVYFVYREPHRGFTPFIEAAAAGHEIIVQYFLLHVSSIKYMAYASAVYVPYILDYKLRKFTLKNPP